MAPPRKTAPAAAQPARRRLTAEEREERARYAAIKPIDGSELDSFYDPKTNSVRTVMLWQPKGASVTDMKRAELVIHDSADGKLHYADQGYGVVDVAGQLQGRVSEERLVCIPKEFRQAKNADAAVSFGDYTPGATYSFQDVARWMGVANAHHQTPVDAPLAPMAAPKQKQPAAIKVATKATPPPMPKMIEKPQPPSSSDDDDDEEMKKPVMPSRTALDKLLKGGHHVSPAAIQAAMAKSPAFAALQASHPKKQSKREIMSAADAFARSLADAQLPGGARKTKQQA